MSAKSFEEWRQLAKVAEANGMDVAAESHRLLADMLEQRAALLADRPEVAGMVERLRCFEHPNEEGEEVMQDAADTLESLAAQLAQRDEEIAKEKSSHEADNRVAEHWLKCWRENEAELAKLKAQLAAEKKEHAKEIRDAIRDAAASAAHAERYPDEPYGVY